MCPHKNILFWGSVGFPISFSNRVTSSNAWNRHSGRFNIGACFKMLNDILKPDQLQWFPNRSDLWQLLWPWYRTWPKYERFPWSICNECCKPAWSVYPFGHLTPPRFGTCICSYCWDHFFPKLSWFFRLCHLIYISVLSQFFPSPPFSVHFSVLHVVQFNLQPLYWPYSWHFFSSARTTYLSYFVRCIDIYQIASLHIVSDKMMLVFWFTEWKR